jgi:flavin-binding protein dodecin
VAENRPRQSGKRNAGGETNPGSAGRNDWLSVVMTGCNRQKHKENAMPAHSYKHIEVTGSSTVGIDDAISTAVAKAGKTLHDLHWFEVVDTRGYIEGSKVKHWQVTVKIGFRLED